MKFERGQLAESLQEEQQKFSKKAMSLKGRWSGELYGWASKEFTSVTFTHN